MNDDISGNWDDKKPYARQNFFLLKDLQLTIATLAVIAMLGALLLQSISSTLSSYLELGTPTLGVVLIIGYIGVIIAISVFFTHRFIGPFKRLERELSVMKVGDVEARLGVRGRDDIYIKNFVGAVNAFITKSNAEVQGARASMASAARRIEELEAALANDHVDAVRLMKDELSTVRRDLEAASKAASR
jgi:hypothetical protein